MAVGAGELSGDLHHVVVDDSGNASKPATVTVNVFQPTVKPPPTQPGPTGPPIIVRPPES
jgi:hypothetical protein